jgi:hypothetical protein
MIRPAARAHSISPVSLRHRARAASARTRRQRHARGRLSRPRPRALPWLCRVSPLAARLASMR